MAAEGGGPPRRGPSPARHARPVCLARKRRQRLLLAPPCARAERQAKRARRGVHETGEIGESSSMHASTLGKRVKHPRPER